MKVRPRRELSGYGNNESFTLEPTDDLLKTYHVKRYGRNEYIGNGSDRAKLFDDALLASNIYFNQVNMVHWDEWEGYRGSLAQRDDVRYYENTYSNFYYSYYVDTSGIDSAYVPTTVDEYVAMSRRYGFE